MEQLKSIIFKQKKESMECISAHAHTRVRNIRKSQFQRSTVPSGLEEKMESQISEAYVKRCYRRLHELGAPWRLRSVSASLAIVLSAE